MRFFGLCQGKIAWALGLIVLGRICGTRNRLLSHQHHYLSQTVDKKQVSITKPGKLTRQWGIYEWLTNPPVRGHHLHNCQMKTPGPCPMPAESGSPRVRPGICVFSQTSQVLLNAQLTEVSKLGGLETWKGPGLQSPSLCDFEQIIQPLWVSVSHLWPWHRNAYVM